MSIIKLFYDVKSDGMSHGLYARKGFNIRKVSDSKLQQAKVAIPFFSSKPENYKMFDPNIRIDPKHEEYCEFVHFAILEALWIDGTVIEDDQAIAVLDRLDKNTN